MKVLVLGATGGTGRLIVRDAVAKGHSAIKALIDEGRLQEHAGAGAWAATFKLTVFSRTG